MEITALGRTGLKVSKVCLGTMTFGIQTEATEAFAIMDLADQAGVTFFDTADAYPQGANPDQLGMTEEIVGDWLRERNARDRIVLATKCFNKMGPGANDVGLSRRHIIAACEASLRRLKTDYIDLYQAHVFDGTTPIEETLSAFDDLVHAGKVRYIGCSNYPAWRLADALWTSKLHDFARYETVQPRYNMLFRMIEDELVPLAQAHEVGILAYNPLAGGVLTGRYRQGRALEVGTRFTLQNNSGEMYQKRYWQEPMFAAVDRLATVVEARGQSMTEVAIAWVLAQPGITCAILGASRAEQLAGSLRGLDVTLDDEVRAVCDDLWFTLPRERDPFYARR